jgi:hypothetical protein
MSPGAVGHAQVAAHVRHADLARPVLDARRPDVLDRDLARAVLHVERAHPADLERAAPVDHVGGDAATAAQEPGDRVGARRAAHGAEQRERRRSASSSAAAPSVSGSNGATP